MASRRDFVQYVVEQCGGAKDYFYIADVDDRDYISLLVRETCCALPEPKTVKSKMAKR
jgi:hypothetical protein